MNHEKHLLGQVVDAMSEHEIDLKQFNVHYPFVNRIVKLIILNRITWEKQMTNDIKDVRMSLVYLINFTLPVLECMGLLCEDSIEDAIYWGTIQLNLGLYLRYIDYAIDGDSVQQSSISRTIYAQAYLNNAIAQLATRDHLWTTQNCEMFMHHLNYEHSIATNKKDMVQEEVWLRVSPLCIVLDMWTNAHNSKFDDCLVWYKLYLTCALLSSDCDDAIEDFYNNRRTLITEQIKKKIKDNYMSATELQSIILQWRKDIERQYEIILNTIQDKYPLWYILIRKFIVADNAEPFFYIRSR